MKKKKKTSQHRTAPCLHEHAPPPPPLPPSHRSPQPYLSKQRSTRSENKSHRSRGEIVSPQLAQNLNHPLLEQKLQTGSSEKVGAAAAPAAATVTPQAASAARVLRARGLALLRLQQGEHGVYVLLRAAVGQKGARVGGLEAEVSQGFHEVPIPAGPGMIQGLKRCTLE